jgi:hypothetical protein
MDESVRAYVDAIDPAHRPLFDRLHRLILEAYPDTSVALAYGMPVYRVGRRRLHVGTWKHGVSVYGWDEGRDGGFVARHPKLKSGRGTIQLRPEAAATIADGELSDLVRSALAD